MSLNVHLAVPPAAAAESAAASSGGHTPNTPEILNSIVNMQASGDDRCPEGRELNFNVKSNVQTIGWLYWF